MKEVVYLLIPGLNDTTPLSKWVYKAVGRRWSRKGMRTEICFMGWSGDEPYQKKLAELNARIEYFHTRDKAIVLVGVSAGATLALLAFAKKQSKVQGVISVCGLLRLAPGDDKKIEFFHKNWYRAAQASQVVLEQLTKVQRSRVLSVVPWRDRVIAPKRATVPGSQVLHLWSIGHITSVFWALLAYRRAFKRFASELH